MFFDLTQLSVYFRYLDFGKEKGQGGREKEGGKIEGERKRAEESEGGENAKCYRKKYFLEESFEKQQVCLSRAFSIGCI